MALTQITTDGIKDGTITGTDLTTNVDFVDNQKLRLGTGNDLQIYHDGTNSYLQNNTGELFIRGNGDDIHLKPVNTEDSLICRPNGAVELYFNGTKRFETFSSGVLTKGDLSIRNSGNTEHILYDESDGALEFVDSIKATFGNGSDLQIYHDGSNSFIQDTGTGVLVVNSNQMHFNNAANDENMIKATENGAVELYHNNVKQIQTTADGVGFVNNCTFSDSKKIQMGAGNDLQIYHGSDSNIIDSTGKNFFILHNSDLAITSLANGAVELYHDNSLRLATDANGIHVTTNVHMNDNGVLELGTGSDLQLFHDGTNSILQNNTGVFYLKTINGEFSLVARPNGATELYYDHSKKFETTNTGATITGSYCIFTGAMGSTENFKIANTTSGGHIQIGLQQQDTDGLHHRAYIKASKGGANIAGKLELLARGSGGGTNRGWIIDAAVGIQANLQVLPETNNTYDLGSTSLRWRNIYTNDLNLSNEGSANDVDGTWGSYTIQEGAEDLFLVNKRSGKKYKFNLTEVA